MSGSQPARRGKKNTGAASNVDETDQLSKLEYQIARYLRLNCAKKQGNLLGMKVDFFIGQKLVDALLESKWGPKSAAPVLADRKACVAFMQKLMNKQLFYRAVKVYKDESKEKSTETDATPSKRKKKSGQQTPSATPKPGAEEPAAGTSESKPEVKRKFKLEMADEQKFEDSSEPFVWVYDPTSTKTYIIGSLLIFGAIGICLFPLWPSQVREGVYYLSLTGASFLGAILALAVLKYIVFGAVWAATFGRVHFWLLPNLTEDVGFLESFVPVYKIVDSNKKNTTTAEASAAAAAAKKDDDLLVESLSEKNTGIEASSILSGSTVEITNSDLTTSTVRRRKSSTSNIREEDDGFELVDDDDAQAQK